MINLLSITKEDNEQFSFVLNSDISTEIINTRNDLLTVGSECHFKTSNGANLIKEQNVLFGNVSLFDGITPISAITSIRDLFDKLTALGFFSWITGGGAGVDRFDDLLDTFEYFGKAGQFVVVSDDELQLTTRDITIVEKSTDLSDMPNAISPLKYLRGNSAGTAYEQVDFVPPASMVSIDFPLLSVPTQNFSIPNGRVALHVYVNNAIWFLATANNTTKPNTFTQSGTTVIMKSILPVNNYVVIDFQ